jgi:hypothetical protein
VVGCCECGDEPLGSCATELETTHLDLRIYEYNALPLNDVVRLKLNRYLKVHNVPTSLWHYHIHYIWVVVLCPLNSSAA